MQRTLGETIEVADRRQRRTVAGRVDANHLESAIVNLAINARDAMPEGGKLTVEAANVSCRRGLLPVNPELPPGQYVAICVTDTGTGMTARRLATPSSRFSRPRKPGKARVSA